MVVRDSHHREIPVLSAPTKKHYICVEPNTSFTISLENMAQHHIVYAPKLFIDGQEVAGFKTLSKFCNYHGFKLGGGEYKQFLFSEPPPTENTVVSQFSVTIKGQSNT